MAKHKTKSSFVCPSCGQEHPLTQGMPMELIHGELLNILHERFPESHNHDYLCVMCLDKIRTDYIQSSFDTAKSGLQTLHDEASEKIQQSDIMTENINREFDQKLTFGERVSDQIAAFGGSWRFILSFMAAIAIWIMINIFVITTHAFDPYPFILLNLVLSCVASLQAPVIMMSQNRQEAKDRLRSENDFKVNLKAELEIQHLHAKMDMLLTTQWQRLLEIQEMQLDMMEKIVQQYKKN